MKDPEYIAWLREKLADMKSTWTNPDRRNWDRVLEEYDELVRKYETLESEHAIQTAFYELAIAERNYEREKNFRLETNKLLDL